MEILGHLPGTHDYHLALCHGDNGPFDGNADNHSQIKHWQRLPLGGQRVSAHRVRLVCLRFTRRQGCIANCLLQPCSTAFLPVMGQLADIFGRRWPMLISVAIFTLGSGLAGAANDEALLVTGRAIQGLGSGGLNMLVDLIICDLVPLRERGRLVSLVNLIFAIGLFVGPFVGGSIVEHSSWRWAFWLSLPIGGASIILLFFFLQVNSVRAPLKERLKSLDYIGTAILIGSASGVLYALTYAGAEFSWIDARILSSLIIGILGLIGFHLYEASPLCKHPTVPPRMFSNRTTSIALFATFTHALMMLWSLYFLPVYFQAVQLVSPSVSGVHILPTVLGMVPAALLAGQYLAKTGTYRLMVTLGAVVFAAGLGSLAALRFDSPKAMWICLQIIPSLGNGILATVLLPAPQAGLTDDDNATSTSTWSYIRSYGAIWGVTIPAAVFNNSFDRSIWKVTDPIAKASLSGGNAYSLASRDFIGSFPKPVQAQIIDVFTDALQVSWAVAAGIMGLTAILTLFMRDIPLRASLQTQFGVNDSVKTDKAKEKKSEKS